MTELFALLFMRMANDKLGKQNFVRLFFNQTVDKIYKKPLNRSAEFLFYMIILHLVHKDLLNYITTLRYCYGYSYQNKSCLPLLADKTVAQQNTFRSIIIYLIFYI